MNELLLLKVTNLVFAAGVICVDALKQCHATGSNIAIRFQLGGESFYRINDINDYACGDQAAKHFPSLHVLRNIAPDCHSIPYKKYLPKRKEHVFEDLRCRFGCTAQFASKAALQRHRV